MKKLFVVVLAGVFSLGLAKVSWAAGYIAGNVGMVHVEDSEINDPDLSAMGILGAEISFDNGVGATLASGVTTDILRFEGEFSYRKNDMDEISISAPVSGSIPVNGEVEAMSLLANVYKDIDTGSAIKPFLGLGIGFSRVDGDMEGDSESDTVFAYQVILGTGIAMNESTSIDISYRYFATSDPEFDTTTVEYATHNFMLGVRFAF